MTRSRVVMALASAIVLAISILTIAFAAPDHCPPGWQRRGACATPTPTATAVATATPTLAPTPTLPPTATPTVTASPSPRPSATATPTPRPSATATPKPSATSSPGAGLLFAATAETGDTDQWCYVHSGVPVGVVTSPTRSGGYAYKSEIRDGVLIYGTERSSYENGPGTCPAYRFASGDETWTAMSYYLAPDFPSYSAWSLVTQWKEPNAGTPPQQIGLQNDRFNIRGRGSESPRPLLDLGPIVRGQWIDFVVHQKWSSDSSVGFVEVYRNGVLVLPLTHLATMEDGSAPLFLSVGEYRDLSNSGTAILYSDDIRIGTTRASVDVH